MTQSITTLLEGTKVCFLPSRLYKKCVVFQPLGPMMYPS